MGRFEVNLGRFAVMLGRCHVAVIMGRFSVYWVYWVVVRSSGSFCGHVAVVLLSSGSFRGHLGP